MAKFLQGMIIGHLNNETRFRSPLKNRQYGIIEHNCTITNALSKNTYVLGLGALTI